MYSDISVWMASVFVLGGLFALAWSSDFFIDGASLLAKKLGISPFVIGMVIIGFGTSAPELCVSAMSGISGHSNLSLGNAYGSCIFNVLVIIGIAAIIHPVRVKPGIAFVAVPCLVAISIFSWYLLSDGCYSRLDAFMQLGLFAVLLPAYCWFEQRGKQKPQEEQKSNAGGVLPALFKLIAGLGVLVGSSHILVWGSVDIARMLGVSELMIGLTVLAVGTSLPELASAIAAARKGKHEFVLGNIIGSNFFNTLAVVGIAGGIAPIEKFSRYVVMRDLPIMIGVSLLIGVFGLSLSNSRKGGRISRIEGLIFVVAFLVYTAVMVWQEKAG